MNDAHAELLRELKYVRATLRERQEDLSGSPPPQADPAIFHQLSEEVNDLSETCMTLAARLWRLTWPEPDGEGGVAAAIPLDDNPAGGR